eukprot:COSAG06_NODE_527_length_14654_cov_6.880179_5_plen_66_part_00
MSSGAPRSNKDTTCVSEGVPSPAPYGGSGAGAGAGDSAYYHVAPDGTYDPFNAQDCALIDAARGR